MRSLSKKEGRFWRYSPTPYDSVSSLSKLRVATETSEI